MKETKHLKLFGIPRILPYLKEVRTLFLAMILFALAGSAVDILLPQFRRYALDHFVALGKFDTLIPFVLSYIFALIFAAVSNYTSCSIATIIEMRVHKKLREVGFRLEQY